MGTTPQPGLDEKLREILAICQKMNSERDLSALLDRCDGIRFINHQLAALLVVGQGHRETESEQET